MITSSLCNQEPLTYAYFNCSSCVLLLPPTAAPKRCACFEPRGAGVDTNDPRNGILPPNSGDAAGVVPATGLHLTYYKTLKLGLSFHMSMSRSMLEAQFDSWLCTSPAEGSRLAVSVVDDYSTVV